ncbi:hypothetical protein LJC59_00070 [Desulfovibrio sp. OttesenSCG-928-A18]|nr:hypothetical protein [Desulfovibrio sp. OttesenSCG-928-A18]
MQKYNIGDEAYIPDGRKVAVTGIAKYGYFVSETYEDKDGFSFIDEEKDSFYVRNLYREVPSPIKDERIINFESSIKEKRAELQQLEKDIAQQKKEIQSICTMYEPLSYLRDFFSGDLKYAILWSDWHIQIGLVPEILKTDDKCDWPKVRLVSLFGKNGKDLEWRVSRYTDGSDKWYPESISFHRTKEDALEHAKKIATERFALFKKRGRECCIVDDLIELGIAIPQDIMVANAAYENKKLQQAKVQAEKDLLRAQEAYEKAKIRHGGLLDA